MIDLVVRVLAWSGGLFVLLAAIGVLRMPDMLSRLQAASKAATLGAALLLLSVAIHFRQGDVAIRAVALGAFLFLTVPIAAHLIGRASYLTATPLSARTVIDEAREVYARDRAESDGPEDDWDDEPPPEEENGDGAPEDDAPAS